MAIEGEIIYYYPTDMHIISISVTDMSADEWNTKLHERNFDLK
jgi:hypothetical protein